METTVIDTFQARSLNSLVDPLMKYDDKLLCAPPPARPQQREPQVVAKGFQLIPNPAKNELMAHFTEPLKDNTLFIIYDIRGQVHLEKRLEAGESIFYVNTSQLLPGIYYCKIGNHSPVYEARKLVIIR
ncbi:MAG: T9SS type A sorting domain-containing protein [Lewinellaceae bacterium]|nr:T9SS type A sorting domain-containing protein [Lewinellaceae bacterium]